MNYVTWFSGLVQAKATLTNEIVNFNTDKYVKSVARIIIEILNEFIKLEN